MITQPHPRDKHRVNKTITVTVEKLCIFSGRMLWCISRMLSQCWCDYEDVNQKVARGQSHLYNRSLESDIVAQHGICEHCNVRVLKRNGWGRSGEDWWAAVQFDSPQTQRQCWKTHRWGDMDVVLFVLIHFFSSISIMCVQHRTRVPQPVCVFQACCWSCQVLSWVRCCRTRPRSPQPWRKHSEPCSWHRSPGKYLIWTGWSYTDCGFTKVLISPFTEEWRRCRSSYLM